MSGQSVMNKWCVLVGLALSGLLTSCGAPGESGRGSHGEEEIVGVEQSLKTAMCGPDSAGDWCGSQSNVIGGDPNTLYHCTPNGVATNPRFCAAGCVQQPPGTDDTCAPAAAHSYVANAFVMDVARNGNFDTAGRLLWGDDLVRGRLGGNRLPTATAPSSLDWTIGSGIAGTGTTVGVRCLSGAAGDWCGSESNVVGGSANVLYHCTPNAPATNARICAASCVENPGKADTCSKVTESITKSAYQCAGFAQMASGAPLTRYWRRGDRAIDRCPVPGTVVATFDGSGNYYGHTAIVVGCSSASLDVFDSNWIDTTSTYLLHVGRHTFTTSGTGLSNAGNYYVVMAP